VRVLVTGGAGYIGSHTAKALARAGFEPVVFDNLSTGHAWAVKWGTFVQGDLADKEAVAAAIREQRVEAVIHFAASAYVGESVEKPRQYFRNNVINTLNLLDAMLDEGVMRIVFSSTCATYGVPETPLITETHPQRPINPYGESKLFVEKALRAYGEAYQLRWMALRYFNAAGADPEGELGEVHDPETHLIPLVMQAAAGQRREVAIYGGDYPTPDGTAVRDYIHVSDLARAHVLGLEHLLGGGLCTALNLGTGVGHSVREVIGAVEQLSGRRVATRVVHRRAGDPPALVADPTRARELLGWQPEFTRLVDVIESAWRWYSRHHQGKGVGVNGSIS
jgi:UDP-arabinose 4-epimerase